MLTTLRPAIELGMVTAPPGPVYPVIVQVPLPLLLENVKRVFPSKSRLGMIRNPTLSEAGADAIAASAGSSLYKPLPKGTTKFDITFTLLRPGLLHVTIYDLDNHDKNDNAYAGIYVRNDK